MKVQLTYCFDLDGTLCTQVDPDNHGIYSTVGETYEAAEPIESRIDFVNRLYDEGHNILIDTARARSYPEHLDEWRSMTERQLEEWGVKYHELRVGVKFGADVYVDDRALNDKQFFSK
jgi:hypothetical protein